MTTSKYGAWDQTQAVDDDLDKRFARWGADAYDRFINVVMSQDLNHTKKLRRLQVAESGLQQAQEKIGLVDEIGGIDDAITYAANITKLEDYQVEYYGEELSNAEVIIKELLENSDVSFGEHKVFSALNGLAILYETLAYIQEPKALLTCRDCLVDLD